MKRRLAVTAALWLVAPAAAVAEPPPSERLAPTDFAHGLQLEVTPGIAVQTLLVPFDVYRQTLQPDLSDLRVFNARSEQVPHAIRTLDQPTRVARGEHPLPLFPIFEPEDGARALDQLALHVERSPSGTIVDIRGAPRAARSEPTRIAAYVLDGSGLQHDLVALRFELEAARTGYSLPVTIEASDDLAQWRTLVAGAVLARLEYAGQKIERDRIELSGGRPRFLRLRWPGDALPAKLVAVHAELAAGQLPPHRERRRVRGRADAGEPGVYDFDLGGPLPVERATIVLPEPNTLVHAELGSRAEGETAYSPAFRGPIYRVVHQEVELASPAADIGRRRHRHFRLRVDGKGGGLGSRLPTLEVDYAPDQLLFMARGTAPFLIAYGSYRAKRATFEPEEILAVVDADARARLPASSARVVANRQLGGEAALTAPAPPLPFRTYALWGVLVGGVALLVALAVRLLRKLD